MEAGGESGGNLKSSLRTVMVTGYLSMPCMAALSTGSRTAKIFFVGISYGLIVHAVSLKTDKLRMLSPVGCQ